MGLLYKRFSFNELERISLGIVLSSFGKLLLIAMAIWNFSDLEHSWLINVIVLASNSVALSGMIFFKGVILGRGFCAHITMENNSK